MMSTEETQDLAPEKIQETLDKLKEIADGNDGEKEKSDFSAADLQAMIAGLLKNDQSLGGQNFQFLQPPFNLEPKLSPKLIEMKAKKARRTNRIKEKNVTNSFQVANTSDPYDVEAVLKSLDEVHTKGNNNKSAINSKSRK